MHPRMDESIKEQLEKLSQDIVENFQQQMQQVRSRVEAQIKWNEAMFVKWSCELRKAIFIAHQKGKKNILGANWIRKYGEEIQMQEVAVKTIGMTIVYHVL